MAVRLELLPPTPSAMDETEAAAPFARATITSTSLTLNDWNPGLIGLGPRNRLLDDLPTGMVLADLTIERREEGNELIVEVIAGALTGRAEQRLISWACAVGYRRIWLPERVLCFEPDQCPLGYSETECPTCGSAWVDKSAGFLVGVRQAGHFPGWCLACGGSLPEWTIASLPGADPGRDQPGIGATKPRDHGRDHR